MPRLTRPDQAVPNPGGQAGAQEAQTPRSAPGAGPRGPVPANEAARLQTLRELRILDSGPDDQFDTLVRAASLACETPISLISLIDEKRQWIKANVGMPGMTETSRSDAFCAYTIMQDDVLEVPDATEDPRFCNNKMVLAAPGVRYYAGVPLRLADGAQVGTLCVIDRVRRQLTPNQLEILRCLAHAAMGALQSSNERRLLRHTTRDLRAAETGLREARDTAEKANRAKTRFLAGMSHEIRTPLNGILGYAQLLRREGGLTTAQIARVDAMLRSGQHLLDIVTSVLDLSEIESDRTVLHPARVDIRQLADSCMELVAPAAAARGLALSWSARPGTPYHLTTDPTRLRQILVNLLGNAVKFTSTGSVQLCLMRAAAPFCLRIEVQDTGCGIPDSQRALLFLEFARLQNDLAAPVEGAGLGLALSARIAALLGGTLGFEQREGGGSIFRLELPQAIAGDGQAVASPAAALAEEAGAAPARPLHVLIVDDVSMNLDIAAAILRTAGHRASCVTSGAEAIEAAAAGGFDVVLMDVRMPDIDGLEATRRIRGLAGPERNVPVIGVTAQAFLEQIHECLKAGMDGHLSKPYAADVLISTVEAAAASGARRRTNAAGSGLDLPKAACPPVELPVLDDAVLGQLREHLPQATITAHLRSMVLQAEKLLHRVDGDGGAQPGIAVLADNAHALAGAAGLLGFAQLAATCRRFERAHRLAGPDTVAMIAGLRAAITACNAITNDTVIPAPDTA